MYPTVDRIYKLLLKSGATPHKPKYKLPRTIMLRWGIKKQKVMRTQEIQFGSNTFATDLKGRPRTVSNWRFNSARDILDLIFTGPT
jgi:hypothetical protein